MSAVSDPNALYYLALLPLIFIGIGLVSWGPYALLVWGFGSVVWMFRKPLWLLLKTLNLVVRFSFLYALVAVVAFLCGYPVLAEKGVWGLGQVVLGIGWVFSRALINFGNYCNC